MDFRPGFRLSVLDIGVLAVGGSAAYFGFMREWPVAFAIAFVVGHFFLFCNVFRMGRALELTWVGVFGTLETTRLIFGMLHLGVVIAVSISATIVLVVIECRKPSYHGILWKKINPELRQWFDAKKTG